MIDLEWYSFIELSPIQKPTLIDRVCKTWGFLQSIMLRIIDFNGNREVSEFSCYFNMIHRKTPREYLKRLPKL